MEEKPEIERVMCEQCGTWFSELQLDLAIVNQGKEEYQCLNCGTSSSNSIYGFNWKFMYKGAAHE